MRQTVRLRSTPTHNHPPYGLFVDPHPGAHAWWAVDPRMVVSLAAILSSIGAFLSIAAR